jgi:hypothetical protein
MTNLNSFAPIRRIRRGSAAALLALVAAVSVATPASAGTGDRDRCQPDAYVSHNNDWNFFWGHKIRVNAAACANTRCTRAGCFAWLPWTRTPVLTFPSRFPIPTGEHVSVAHKPYVSGMKRDAAGRVYRVSYQFSVKSCAGICQTFDFRVTYSIAGTQICSIRAACDDFKGW